MKFKAIWGIYIFKGRSMQPETQYEESVEFEANTPQAAKPLATRLMKKDPEMKVLRKSSYYPSPPRWQSWGNPSKGYADPTISYFTRVSDLEYEGGYNGNTPSIEYMARLTVAWRPENPDQPV